MRGKLIVIAGTDGSGKRTQTEILLDRLRGEGRDAKAISFPQYETSFFGAMAGQYLRGEFGPSEAVHPRLAAMVFALDRWEAKSAMAEWLGAGRVVVADRYTSANAGHQAIKIADPTERRAFIAWVEEMEYEVLGLPRPDLTVFLHVPWRIAQALVGQKGEREYLRGARRDIHEADPDHLARSEAAYLEQAQAHTDWATIECCEEGRMLARDEIAERVWQAVRPAVGDSGKSR